MQVPRERRYNASAPEQTDALATYFPEIVERIVKYQSYKQQVAHITFESLFEYFRSITTAFVLFRKGIQ